MAYGVKYRFPFQSVEGVDWTIDILKDGYSGSILTRAIGGSPILRRDKSDNICGTSLELTAECLVDGEFEELSSSNPFMFQVKVYHSNNGSTSELVWQGYVTPEIYSAPEVAPPYDVRVTATDGLGELKLNNFEAQGMKTLSAMLAYLLGFTGLSLGIRQASDLSCSAAAAGAVLSSVYINLDYLAGETCYDVLQRLLATIDSTITQDGSYWLIFKETGLSVNTTNYTFGYYENGVSKQRSILRYGSAATHPAGFWPVGKMNREFVAPKKKILITADNHYKRNIFGTWNLIGDATDEGNYLSLPDADDGMSQIVTFTEEIQKHLLLSIKVRNVGDGNDAGNLSISVKLAGSFYQASQYLYLTNSIGDRRRDTVAVTWSTNPAAKCLFEVQAPVESDTDQDYVTVELVIPLYHNSARSYVLASSLEIQVTNGDTLYPKRIYGITLSQYEQTKGLQKVVNIDNGSRGEAPDVEVAFAGTTGPNNYTGLEELLDGVPMTSAGAKITSWSTGAFSSLDFLSLIARDYALKYVSSRRRVNGILQTDPDLKAVPVMFADDYDGELYIVDTFSWDLYNDEQTVEMVSRPASSLNVESESVTPIDGATSSGGGSASGGGWSAPGSGTSLLSVWRSLANDSTLENYGNSTAIAAEHLTALFTVETLSGGDKYLRLNPQFVGLSADGWLSSGGVGSGSSGGGGVDLNRVWESLTNNTDKPNVTIHPAHIPIATDSAVGGVKVDGVTIVIQNGTISAVAQGAGSVTSVGISVPTGFSVSNSPVTASGTIAISFADGYSLPTTAKQGQWDSAYVAMHSHSNKSVLDSIYSSDVGHWDDAYSAMHSHSNKSVLDGISSSDVSHWGSAYVAMHSHSNKSVLDSIYSSDVGHWDDAYSAMHSHSNKSVLDGISSSDVSHWDDAYGWGDHAQAGYASSQDLAGYLPLTGGTMTGAITMSGANILTSADSTNNIGASDKRFNYGHIRNIYTTFLAFKSGDGQNDWGNIGFGATNASIIIGQAPNQSIYNFRTESDNGFFHNSNGYLPCGKADHRWSVVYGVAGDYSGNLSVSGVINVKGYNTIDQSHDSSGDMQLLIGYGSRGAKSTSIYGSSVDLRACDSSGNLANLLSVQSSKVIVRSHLRPDDSVSGISVNLGGSGTDQRWANIYGVNADLSGDLVLGSTSHIDIGPLRLEYDATNKALRITKKSSSDTNKYSLYTDGFLDAGGVHQSS